MREKILFIMHYPPPVHGAAMVGKYIKESSLVNESFNTRYVNLGISNYVAESGKKPWTKITRYINLLWVSLRKLITFNPTVVYLTLTSAGVGFYKDAVIVLLAKLFGKKTVFHFHNKGVREAQHHPFDNWLYKRVFKNSDVILLSFHLYQDIEKYVPLNRVHFCANGIPDLPTRPQLERDNPSQKVELLCLSNLMESKGIYHLLEACHILKKKGIPFHCTFVGGENDITVAQFMEKIEQLELTQHVRYAGRKYGKDKRKIYNEADLFVLYSHDDCFPLVLLEAMQHALPVVSTHEGGIPEIVEEGRTGTLVAQENVPQLAKTLEELITNKKMRRRMGDHARARFEENYTLEAFERRFTELMRQLVLKNEKDVSSVKEVW